MQKSVDSLVNAGIYTPFADLCLDLTPEQEATLQEAHRMISEVNEVTDIGRVQQALWMLEEILEEGKNAPLPHILKQVSINEPEVDLSKFQDDIKAAEAISEAIESVCLKIAKEYHPS